MDALDMPEHPNFITAVLSNLREINKPKETLEHTSRT
uniref:Uncharacterized protein n=1 Tax=Arundo donax TaxID=35708 RepID=A0A0A8YZG5_ARUDO